MMFFETKLKIWLSQLARFFLNSSYINLGIRPIVSKFLYLQFFNIGLWTTFNHNLYRDLTVVCLASSTAETMKNEKIQPTGPQGLKPGP
jgi:hypothetical protein